MDLRQEVKQRGKSSHFITLSRYGGYGNLYIEENYRRRGLAKQLIKVVARKMADLDVMPQYTMVEDYNVGSKTLFESMGMWSESLLFVIAFCPPGHETIIKGRS